MPREKSLFRKLVCHISAQATVRSRSMESEPESAVRKRSLVTLRGAVSVL